MRWYAWLATAAVTAAVGMVASGLLAGLLVDWYRVSSFEGGAGFFVVGIALLGAIGGFIVGIVASAIVAFRQHPGFLKALGVAVGSSIGIVLIVGAGARLLADIPPQIAGDPLLLQIELRWPAAGQPPPASLEGPGIMGLGALSGSVVRRLEEGPLWLEDAREEAGRWIAPGAAHIFTGRGKRFVDLTAGETRLAAFIVPLPGRPRPEHESWSGWLPAGPKDAAEGFTYRFRVVRSSQPVRVQRSGPFEVAVIAWGFQRASARDPIGAASTFRISHNGQPVPGLEGVNYVAEVAAPRPALFVRRSGEDYGHRCAFVIEEPAGPRVADLGRCDSYGAVQPVTSDPRRFRNASRKPVDGYVDRLTFDSPGLFIVSDMVVDTRDSSGRTFTLPPQPYPMRDVPPLTLSPDERSFALYAHGADEEPVLLVVDRVADASYIVPIDRTRMRYSTRSALDPAWVDHHFEWVRQDGADRLQPRAGFELLPHKGELSEEESDLAYRLWPGGERLRDAVVEILQKELGAERLPDSNYGFDRSVRIDGVTIEVSAIASGGYVSVSPARGTGSVALMRTIAERVDAALATRRWDDAFDK